MVVGNLKNFFPGLQSGLFDRLLHPGTTQLCTMPVRNNIKWYPFQHHRHPIKPMVVSCFLEALVAPPNQLNHMQKQRYYIG